ncbi:MAG: hypothetical protein K5770_12195 [Lachnospiraceae bacterium]|nr:hypothetical protein [Lachnospiraceae bacterium]
MKKKAGLIELVMAAACFLNFMPGVTPVNASVKKNTKIEENKTSSEKSEADADKTDAQKGGKSGGKNNTPDKGTEDQDLYIEADSLCCLARDMYIEDMMSHYCINLVDDGKYSDYEGDIGDVILEYKDVDLDGDGEPDAIKRKGQEYVIKFSDGGTLETGDFSSLPNEGEVIEFADISEDNVDEILFTHYTEGTAGPAAWDTTLYTRVDGEWTAFPVINENGINSTELQKDIEKRTGEAYAPDLPFKFLGAALQRQFRL